MGTGAIRGSQQPQQPNGVKGINNGVKPQLPQMGGGKIQQQVGPDGRPLGAPGFSVYDGMNKMGGQMPQYNPTADPRDGPQSQTAIQPQINGSQLTPQMLTDLQKFQGSPQPIMQSQLGGLPQVKLQPQQMPQQPMYTTSTSGSFGGLRSGAPNGASGAIIPQSQIRNIKGISNGKVPPKPNMPSPTLNFKKPVLQRF